MDGRSVEDLLTRQLEVLQAIHGSQAELQRELVATFADLRSARDVSSLAREASRDDSYHAVLPGSIGECHLDGLDDEANPQGSLPSEDRQSEKPVQKKLPAAPGFRRLLAVGQSIAPKQMPAGVSHWLDDELVEPHENSSYFQFVASILRHSLTDSIMPHCLQMEFSEAILKSQQDPKYALIQIAMQKQLLAMLLLTVTVPHFLALPAPEKSEHVPPFLLGFAMSFANIVMVMLDTALVSVMQVVSEPNFQAWAISNKRCFRLGSVFDILTIYLIVAGGIEHMLRSLHSMSLQPVFESAWVGLMVGTACIICIAIVVVVASVNVISRSALYSGAMSTVRLPHASSEAAMVSNVFACVVSGNRMGIKGMVAYYEKARGKI